MYVSLQPDPLKKKPQTKVNGAVSKLHFQMLVLQVAASGNEIETVEKLCGVMNIKCDQMLEWKMFRSLHTVSFSVWISPAALQHPVSSYELLQTPGAEGKEAEASHHTFFFRDRPGASIEAGSIGVAAAVRTALSRGFGGSCSCRLFEDVSRSLLGSKRYPQCELRQWQHKIHRPTANPKASAEQKEGSQVMKTSRCPLRAQKWADFNKKKQQTLFMSGNHTKQTEHNNIQQKKWKRQQYNLHVLLDFTLTCVTSQY